MRWLEDIMNKMTDTDAGWWPYISLRPEKDEVMDNKFVLRLTLYYTPIFGAFYVFVLVFFPQQQFPGIEPRLLVYAGILIFFMAFFFLGFRLTSAVAWNSRARRLRKQKRKPEPVME